MDPLLLNTTHLPGDNVRIVIFTNDGDRFAVVRESDDASWKLPGGNLESGETVAEAAARELGEELGVILEPNQLTFSGKLMTDNGNSSRYIFTVGIDPQRIQPSDEIASIEWFSFEDIPEGKNKQHILTAAQLAQTSLLTTH